LRYQELRPCPRLGRHVECLWFLEGAGKAEARAVERIIPDGCSELIVHLGEPFERLTGRGFERQDAAFLIGQLDRFILLRPSARIDTIGVRFKPAGARRFFREPAHGLAGSFVPLADVWGARAPGLLERLHEAASPAARARVLEGALLEALDEDADEVVARAVSWVLRGEGRASVAEAARHAGLSERSLERRFQSELGLGPKAFARIIRLQGVLRATSGQPRPDWADVAAERSFFDQPHLIREFKALTGETPAEFLRNQGRLSMNFTDPARLAALLAG
jgi:AraC-like DNA-binding protein